MGMMISRQIIKSNELTAKFSLLLSASIQYKLIEIITIFPVVPGGSVRNSISLHKKFGLKSSFSFTWHA